MSARPSRRCFEARWQILRVFVLLFLSTETAALVLSYHAHPKPPHPFLRLMLPSSSHGAGHSITRRLRSDQRNLNGNSGGNGGSGVDSGLVSSSNTAANGEAQNQVRERRETPKLGSLGVSNGSHLRSTTQQNWNVWKWVGLIWTFTCFTFALHSGSSLLLKVSSKAGEVGKLFVAISTLLVAVLGVVTTIVAGLQERWGDLSKVLRGEMRELRGELRGEIRNLVSELQAQRAESTDRFEKLLQQTAKQQQEITEKFAQHREDTAKQQQEITEKFAQHREDIAKQQQEITEKFTQHREDTVKQLAHQQQENAKQLAHHQQENARHREDIAKQLAQQNQLATERYEKLFDRTQLRAD